MSEQSHFWYVRGEGNQPAGPFTAEVIIESWQAGRLNANTICWREGMSQWLPLSQVEPFASAIASASVPRQAMAGAARSPAPPTGVPSSLFAGSRPAGRRRAPPAWIGWAIAGGLAAILAVVAGVVLLLNSRTTNWGSAYTVDYQMASAGGFDASLKTTVKGPAAKLAVILTDPKGESDTQIIEKENMISNCHTVELPMQTPRAGTYVLTVKTVEPERVVWKKNIPLSLGELAVVDVTCDLSPNFGPFEGYFINSIKVVLKKDGNLPVKFTDVSAAVDGKESHQSQITSGHTMIDQQHTVGILVNFSPTAEMEKLDRVRGGLPHVGAFFRPGERHLVKGKLSFGEDNRSVEFEKEFVVPQGKKIGDGEASVPGPSSGIMPPSEEPTASPSGPLRRTPPSEYNTATCNAPPGLREGIDRLLQHVKDNNDLAGNFNDYRVIVPPNYTGNETQYEVGLRRPGSTFYVFHTNDGGQTWSPLPPTNPYLIKMSNREVERARRTAGSSTSGAHHQTAALR